MTDIEIFDTNIHTHTHHTYHTLIDLKVQFSEFILRCFNRLYYWLAMCCQYNVQVQRRSDNMLLEDVSNFRWVLIVIYFAPLCTATWLFPLNTLRQTENGRGLADIFDCIFLNSIQRNSGYTLQTLQAITRIICQSHKHTHKNRHIYIYIYLSTPYS